MFKRLVILAQVCLVYNVFLLASVVLNLNWARSRAAGGQYESFPLWLKIIDGVLLLVMIFFYAILENHKIQPMSGNGPLVASIIGYLFVFSTTLQLISRSPNERWNAIPAGILAITFLLLAKRDRKAH